MEGLREARFLNLFCPVPLLSFLVNFLNFLQAIIVQLKLQRLPIMVVVEDVTFGVDGGFEGVLLAEGGRAGWACGGGRQVRGAVNTILQSILRRRMTQLRHTRNFSLSVLEGVVVFIEI